MILSHKYKFIFIKTAKTAGTSIEVFLSKQCGPTDVVTPIAPPVEGHQPRNYNGFINPIPEIIGAPGKFWSALHLAFMSREKFYNHMSASEVRSRVPPHVWKSYFKFCVERNPWDKVLSHYHMRVARQGGSLSLDDYLAAGRFPVNYFRYTDAGGEKIIVDRVLRYENLMNDLAAVFSKLNVPFKGSLGIRAKSEYRIDRMPYHLVFNDKQRKIVENAFAREIELHDYSF